jgi:hypothetical protein
MRMEPPTWERPMATRCEPPEGTRFRAKVIVTALIQIARGRLDNGRPFNATVAQNIARVALIEGGMDWSKIAPARPATDGEAG